MSKTKIITMQESVRADFDIVQCPECNSTEIIRDYERAELVCSACGLVLMEAILDTNRIDRRAYTTEERNARDHNGAPLSSMLPDFGLSTKIDNHRSNRRFMRIRQWHTRLDWPRRNILIATNEIRRLGALLGIPKQVEENAALLYRKVFKLELLRGRSINSFVAACTYISCRLNRIPRTLNEICKISKSRSKTIRHSIHIIIRELNLKVLALNPSDLVSSFTNKLKLSNNVERRALEIIQIAYESNIILGKDPKGVAAAAIYIATLENVEKRSQSDISNITGITEVTLRNRYRELKAIVKLNF